MRSSNGFNFGKHACQDKQMNETYLTNFWRTFVMIFAEWAILLLGSLKVRALCAIYLTSHINAERRLRITRGGLIHTNCTKRQIFVCQQLKTFQGQNWVNSQECKYFMLWPACIIRWKEESLTGLTCRTCSWVAVWWCPGQWDRRSQCSRRDTGLSPQDQRRDL